MFNGHNVADSQRVKLLHETGRTPVYYFPEADVREDLLRPSGQISRTPHTGLEKRWSLVVGDRKANNAAWSYSELPKRATFSQDTTRSSGTPWMGGTKRTNRYSLPDAAKIKDLLAFYNERVELEVDGERVHHARRGDGPR